MAGALGLVGRIGSGKTSLATEVARNLECPLASFGDFVRRTAAERGLDAEQRGVLQAVGDDLIEAGWEPFCRAVLAEAGYSGGSVVIDGIRHSEALRTVRRIIRPTALHVVAVTTPDSERLKRLGNRGMSTAEIDAADGHSNEREVGAILSAADLIIDSRTPAAEAATEVVAWLSNHS
jgi:dephospho-CoA kinase